MNKQEKKDLIKYIEKHTQVQNTPLGRLETVRSSALIDKIKQLDKPQVTDEQAWNKIAEAYPETAQNLRSTLDHAVYGTSKTLKRLQELESDWSQIFDSEKSFDEWVEDQVYRSKDEPQKVKVKQFVADWFEEHKHDLSNSLWEFTVELNEKTKVMGALSEFESWFIEHPRAYEFITSMGKGYGVEEEPKWAVIGKQGYLTSLKIGKGEAKGWTGNSDKFTSGAIHFEDKEKAEAVALLVSGEIEKV